MSGVLSLTGIYCRSLGSTDADTMVPMDDEDDEWYKYNTSRMESERLLVLYSVSHMIYYDSEYDEDARLMMRDDEISSGDGIDVEMKQQGP